MKKYGEIAYVLIVESYNPYTLEQYEKICKEYEIEAHIDDIQYVIDEFVERMYLEIEPETGIVSLNFENTDIMDEMAYELQFNDEVAQKFANVINKHGDIDICFNYLPDISHNALNETIKEMM
ncbi:molybdopterin converting factor small subunit [Bacilli bacterium PM5-3]|nr:molybdopterin converting factor small subunit [Bacilli bacterium PM5-3]MDH6603623.1 molybdopterin converting factor small subunit [Bacilli bacterium PM5-9]